MGGVIFFDGGWGAELGEEGAGGRGCRGTL